MIFKTNGSKIVFDRKKLLYYINNTPNLVDYSVCAYLDSKIELDTDIELGVMIIDQFQSC